MKSNKQIRHLQSLLYTSGVGIILFSLWSGIRDIELFLEEVKASFHTLDLENPVFSERTIYILAGILFFSFIAGVILLHIYIGRKAILFSLGRIKNNKYVIWAIMNLGLSIYSYIYDWQDMGWKKLLELDKMVLFVIDITSNIILAEIIIFSIVLKRMRN